MVEDHSRPVQVANVLHPNQPNNTVVVSIMEAKDLRSNLMLCSEHFKAHIDKFSAVTWEGKVFRVFLFGDYEFLCKMFGLSGASGKHPCLWYQIPSDMMNLPPSDRVHYAPRSLESLTENLEEFGVNVKKAKFVKNVINDRFFNVPLTQVCVPGLHITLGVVFCAVVRIICS